MEIDKTEVPAESGQTMFMPVTFDAGTYMAVCFVEDPATGLPHLMEGMISVVQVGGGVATPTEQVLIGTKAGKSIEHDGDRGERTFCPGHSLARILFQHQGNYRPCRFFVLLDGTLPALTTLSIEVESGELSFELIRKPIKNVYIRVDQHNGQVRVSAPVHLREEAIETIVRSRREWIGRRQAAVLARNRAGKLDYEDGDVVPVFGVPHNLRIVDKPVDVAGAQRDRVVSLFARPGTSREHRAALLDDWYRARLGQVVTALIDRWEPIMSVKVRQWRIRRMRTRWGSCNIGAQRIWLNLELARHPVCCLTYVVVHEMTHLLERGHNARFYALMDQFLPDWRDAREVLKSRAPF